MAELENLFKQRTAVTPWQQGQWQQFVLHGFPSRKQESWKYTGLASLEKRQFPLATKPQKVSQNVLLSLGELAKLPTLIIADGYEFLTPELQNTFPELRSVLPLNGGMIGKPLALVNLNAALCTGGIYLTLRAGEKSTLLIVHHNSQMAQSHSRHHITVEEGAELTLIEMYLGEGSYWQNSATTVAVNKNAKLSYAKIQEDSMSAFHTSSTLIELSEHARCETFSLSSGSQLQRQELCVRLNGAGSEAHLYGLCLADEKQHHDLRTDVEHMHAHSTSTQLFKSILNDEAHSVFNGRIFIAQDAQQVNSQLMNKNLLLSSRAEVDTKPELEIYADDVKANHGATIGQLDEAELFYLQSRGIDKATAVHLLVQGFVEDVVGKFPNQSLHNYVVSRIAERMNKVRRTLEV